MTLTIHYSTFIAATIHTIDGDSFEYNFYKCMTLSDATEWALGAMEYDALSIPSKMIDGIVFYDAKTGELLLECNK